MGVQTTLVQIPGERQSDYSSVSRIYTSPNSMPSSQVTPLKPTFSLPEKPKVRIEEAEIVSRKEDKQLQDTTGITELLPQYASSTMKESAQPQIPNRTTSRKENLRRRRHQELVDLHRESCKLFSSLDATVAQIRTASESSTSSTSSLSSTTLAGSGPNTRDSSLDYSIADPSFKAEQPAKRPPMNRSQRVTPATTRTERPQMSRAPTYAIKLPDDVGDTLSPLSTAPSTLPLGPSITTYSSRPAQSLYSTIKLNPTTTETIHWTSPESRRKEYERIDAANTGVRLFLRKVFPKNFSRHVGGGRAGFWDEVDDDDRRDSVSVRRFRLGSRLESETHVKSISARTTEVSLGSDDGSDLFVEKYTDHLLKKGEHSENLVSSSSPRPGSRSRKERKPKASWKKLFCFCS